MPQVVLKRSAVPGKVPTTGDLALGEIAINTYDGKLFIKKNVSGTETIVDVTGGSSSTNLAAEQTVVLNTFTGNGSQTNFTLSTVPLGDQFIFVTINGVAQHVSEYSYAGSILTFTEAPANGDLIEVRTMTPFSANVSLRNYKVFKYTVTNVTTVSGNDVNGSALTYDPGFVEVFLNGIRLIEVDDFTANSGSTITFSPAITGDLVIVSLARAYFPDIPFASATASLSTTTANQVVDTFGVGQYRTAKYLVQMTQGTSYHSLEVLLIHNGTTVFMTEYAEIFTGSSLGTVDADISGGLVRLLVSPVNTSTTVKVLRTQVGT